jgi:glycosyltransferase involved in cell wall biosynthesis
LKVLHLNRFFYSGQTTHVFSLVKEQQQQGHAAHLAIEGYPPRKAFDVYKNTLERLNVKVTKPGDEATLARLIKKFRYDLIHAHSPLTFAMARKLSANFNIPYVITCHRLGLNKEQYRTFLKGAAVLFCISPRVARSMHEFSEKIHVITNGVDLEEFKPTRKTEPVKIALVARIDTNKQAGYNHLCKAVGLLEKVEFFVASNKPPDSRKAKYLGWTDQIAGLLSKTDIVVGTGRAIVEGLAAGNAGLVLGNTYQGVLATEKMESGEYLDLSGLAGIEPSYKDIFFDLSNLTQDRAYLRKLQAGGRKLAQEQYNIREICGYILHIYRSVSR